MANHVNVARGAVQALNFVWTIATLEWDPEIQPTGGGGGGGGAVTIASGADVTEGALTDVAVQGDNAGSISAKLRGLNKSIAAGIAVTNAGLSNLDVALSTRLKPADTLTKVATVDTITNPVAVTGAFFQGTQPVSLASAPTTPVTNASLDGTTLASIKADLDKIPSQGQALAAASTPVVLPATQITTLTPPTNTGYALDATLSTIDTDIKSNITLHAGTNLIGKVGIDQTTDGTTNKVFVGNIPHVIVDTVPTTAVTNAGLSNLDVLLSTRTKPADQQHAIVDSGTLTAVTAITNALPAGSNVIGHVINDTGSTTAVTGNVTVVQPTGTNLHVVVDTAPTTAVTATSLPLPTNASQETGGNLDTIRQYITQNPEILLLREIITELKVLNFTLQASLNSNIDIPSLRVESDFQSLYFTSPYPN